MFLFGVLDEGEISGGFSEMEDDATIDQVTSRLGKMRDASCCECRDKLLMINLLIKPWPDR